MSSERELNRLRIELQEIQRQNEKAASEGGEGGITATTVGDNLLHWKGKIKGPIGTPYEGGTFHLDIRLPGDYPYAPPKMMFDTKIWHPNISSQTGAICLDILKNEWSPAQNIRTALLSIQALLSAPEPDDPQDAEVASMYKSDSQLFFQTAKYWTETFAYHGGTQEDKVGKIVEMGFSEEQAKVALQSHQWDETLCSKFVTWWDLTLRSRHVATVGVAASSG